MKQTEKKCGDVTKDTGARVNISDRNVAPPFAKADVEGNRLTLGEGGGRVGGREQQRFKN